MVIAYLDRRIVAPARQSQPAIRRTVQGSRLRWDRPWRPTSSVAVRSCLARIQEIGAEGIVSKRLGNVVPPRYFVLARCVRDTAPAAALVALQRYSWKGRGQLVLEIACWFALFALIGGIAYQAESKSPLAALRTRYMRERGDGRF